MSCPLLWVLEKDGDFLFTHLLSPLMWAVFALMFYGLLVYPSTAFSITGVTVYYQKSILYGLHLVFQWCAPLSIFRVKVWVYDVPSLSLSSKNKNTSKLD